MSFPRPYIFPLILIVALWLLGSCAVSEPDFEDRRPSQKPDTDLPDIEEDAPDKDAIDDKDSNQEENQNDISEDAEDDASPGQIELCPFGCEPHETCTDDGCVDLCADAGYQCGQWTLRGHQVQCGTCPSGHCEQGQCTDICADFVAQCGEVFWEGEAVDCGTCPNFERCRDHQCAEPNGFIDITSGTSHTCGLRPNYEVRCWGNNEYGQLGNNKMPTDASTPERVLSLSGARTLHTHSNHTCATLDSSLIQCWGRNNKGNLGDQSTIDRAQRVDVANLVGSVETVTGGSHTCSLQQSGRVRCWGDNSQGQLGKGDVNAEPVLQKNLVRQATGDYLEEIQQITLGSAFSCALRRDNQAFCWGYNRQGQLGGGDNTTGSRWAAPVDSAVPLARIQAGMNHVCAIAVGGNVYCWGRGARGQIGDNSTQDAHSPRLVDLPARAISISAGQDHSCAALETGAVYCWGDNEYGQLGQGSMGGSFATPRLVNGLSNVHIITCGAHHTCALDRQGQAHCWGRNHQGQLGNGSTTSQASPTLVVQ